MNRLTLKMLLLDTIGKLKHGTEMELTRNITQARVQFKKAVGLPKNASAEQLFNALCTVYIDNNLKDELNQTLQRFKLKTI